MHPTPRKTIPYAVPDIKRILVVTRQHLLRMQLFIRYVCRFCITLEMDTLAIRIVCRYSAYYFFTNLHPLHASLHITCYTTQHIPFATPSFRHAFLLPGPTPSIPPPPSLPLPPTPANMPVSSVKTCFKNKTSWIYMHYTEKSFGLKSESSCSISSSASTSGTSDMETGLKKVGGKPSG